MKNIFYYFLFLNIFMLNSSWSFNQDVVLFDKVNVTSDQQIHNQFSLEIYGTIPDLCSGDLVSEVRYSDYSIIVDLYRQKPYSSLCAQSIRPFVKNIIIGPIGQGEYELYVNDTFIQNISSKFEEKLDNLLYINNARIIDNVLEIHGERLSDCYQLDNIKWTYSGERGFVAIPLLKKVRSFCPKKITPINYQIPLPTNIKLNLQDAPREILSASGQYHEL